MDNNYTSNKNLTLQSKHGVQIFLHPTFTVNQFEEKPYVWSRWIMSLPFSTKNTTCRANTAFPACVCNQQDIYDPTASTPLVGIQLWQYHVIRHKPQRQWRRRRVRTFILLTLLLFKAPTQHTRTGTRSHLQQSKQWIQSIKTGCYNCNLQ